MANTGLSLEALEAVTDAAKALEGAELASGQDFHFAQLDAAFASRVRALRARVDSALADVPDVAAPPGAEVLGEIDDLLDWASESLRETLARAEDAANEYLSGAEERARLGAAEGALGLRAASPAQGTAGGQAAASSGGRVSPAPVAGVVRSPSPTPGGQRSPARPGQFSLAQAGVERPQTRFADGVDNSNVPWLPRFDGARALYPAGGEREAAEVRANRELLESGRAPNHPLREVLWALPGRHPERQLQRARPVPPRDPADTPFSFVDTLEALEATCARLARCSEIAVDLEAHSHRSYQGFTCLVQLSTRTEDVVVDALALRADIPRLLGPILSDPAILKVLHGSDSDLPWLARDFGAYVVNLFDTGQAARVLRYPGLGLAYLLRRHAGVEADKRYQLADWRARPLSEEALEYARGDTHSLLYVYDVLREELLDMEGREGGGDEGPGGDGAGWDGPPATPPRALAAVPETLLVPLPPGVPKTPLGLVLERSRRLCFRLHEREVTTPTSFLAAAARMRGGDMDDRQLAAFRVLYEWRDRVARADDESIGYLLPKASLVKAARDRPGTSARLLQIVGPRAPPQLRRDAAELARAIRDSEQDAAKVGEMRRGRRATKGGPEPADAGETEAVGALGGVPPAAGTPDDRPLPRVVGVPEGSPYAPPGGWPTRAAPGEPGQVESSRPASAPAQTAPATPAEAQPTRPAISTELPTLPGLSMKRSSLFSKPKGAPAVPPKVADPGEPAPSRPAAPSPAVAPSPVPAPAADLGLPTPAPVASPVPAAGTPTPKVPEAEHPAGAGFPSAPAPVPRPPEPVLARAAKAGGARSSAFSIASRPGARNPAVAAAQREVVAGLARDAGLLAGSEAPDAATSARSVRAPVAAAGQAPASPSAPEEPDASFEAALEQEDRIMGDAPGPEIARALETTSSSRAEVAAFFDGLREEVAGSGAIASTPSAFAEAETDATAAAGRSDEAPVAAPRESAVGFGDDEEVPLSLRERFTKPPAANKGGYGQGGRRGRAGKRQGGRGVGGGRGGSSASVGGDGGGRPPVPPPVVPGAQAFDPAEAARLFAPGPVEAALTRATQRGRKTGKRSNLARSMEPEGNSLAIPEGMFNPYGGGEPAIAGAKRSRVAPSSGNKTLRF